MTLGIMKAITLGFLKICLGESANHGFGNSESYSFRVCENYIFGISSVRN